MLTFPAGKHDDQVDALGLVGQLLDKMTRGTARKPEAKAPRDSWARLFDRQDLGVADWRIAWGQKCSPRTQRPLIDGEQGQGRLARKLSTRRGRRLLRYRQSGAANPSPVHSA